MKAAIVLFAFNLRRKTYYRIDGVPESRADKSHKVKRETLRRFEEFLL